MQQQANYFLKKKMFRINKNKKNKKNKSKKNKSKKNKSKKNKTKKNKTKKNKRKKNKNLSKKNKIFKGGMVVDTDDTDDYTPIIKLKMFDKPRIVGFEPIRDPNEAGFILIDKSELEMAIRKKFKKIKRTTPIIRYRIFNIDEERLEQIKYDSKNDNEFGEEPIDDISVCGYHNYTITVKPFSKIEFFIGPCEVLSAPVA